MQLTGKIFISGRIIAKTGLHIGGSKSSLDIGGVDLNVIKTPQGVPFIPGSSLKGKLRSMLARVKNSVAVSPDDDTKKAGQKTDEDFREIFEIFGFPGDESGENKGNSGNTPTRLIVRDAFLDAEAFDERFDTYRDNMDMDYSEVKWENTINRKTGTAQHPRQLERVPAGAEFRFEMVYDVYDDNKTTDHLQHIRTAMRLLEGDYIGGQGSRGYGQIQFEKLTFEIKNISEYEGDNQRKPYEFTY